MPWTIGREPRTPEIPFGCVFGAAGYERVTMSPRGCAKLPSELARPRASAFRGLRSSATRRTVARSAWGYMPGLYFEEFEVGQHFRHAVHRTVTETDNVLFSTLTMNPAALHLDAEYCKTTPFGQPIVNS